MQYSFAVSTGYFDPKIRKDFLWNSVGAEFRVAFSIGSQ